MRRTQTEEYWRDEFDVTEEDLGILYELFLEEGVPRSTDYLAQRLMERRCQEEEEALQKALEGKGTVYQPRDSYAVGERLFFPALGGVTGTVVGVRPGENPGYGEFSVIQVELEGTEGVREFAADFPLPHRLNRDEKVLPPAELYRRYGHYLLSNLWERLEASPDFVHFGDQWFLGGLMVEVHVGHLNIAEAMIDLADAPLTSEELLKEMELSEDIPLAARIFSLNYALAQDERFVNVGSEGSPRWFLAYHQAEEVVSA
ncbi:MAG TPA: hypothetical protein EYP55_04305 [Anaerolineae bacterium]|nr:hypothetical protein [Anaerolineae bacterium]